MKQLLLVALLASSVATAEEANPTATPTPGPRRPGGSLADSVRRNQPEPSKTKKKSLGVITNENLGKGEGEVKIKKGTLNVAPAQKPEPAETAPVSEWKDAEGHTEAYWRGRATELRNKAEALEKDVKRLDQETRRLENDFYAWSDGNYRDQKIRPAWDQAREELRAKKDELAKTRNALDSLADDARKAGAPPGWIR